MYSAFNSESLSKIGDSIPEKPASSVSFIAAMIATLGWSLKSPRDLSSSNWYMIVDDDAVNLWRSSNNNTHEPCFSAMWLAFDINSGTVQVVPLTVEVPEIEYLAKSLAKLKSGRPEKYSSPLEGIDTVYNFAPISLVIEAIVEVLPKPLAPYKQIGRSSTPLICACKLAFIIAFVIVLMGNPF